MIKIGVLGAGGRMGQAIIQEIQTKPDCRLAGGVERPGHPSCGSIIGDGMIVCANVQPVAHKADVMIDFTSPAALEENLRAAIDGKCALVIGTTGLEKSHHAQIDKAARIIPILQAANTSLGVSLLASLVEQAARALGDDWDIEIAELHHRHKVDAPSGTALFLGEAAARGRGAKLEALRLPPHESTAGARKPGGIGFATLRGGSAAGDHRVMLIGEGERIELCHMAENREIFARGAVRAARWLSGKPVGRYSMADIFADPGKN